MASNVPKSSLTECQICLQSMVGRNPRALPCLHSFCEECLVSLTRSDSQRVCPNCGLQSQAQGTGNPYEYYGYDDDFGYGAQDQYCLNCGMHLNDSWEEYDSHYNTGNFACPSCRSTTTLPPGGVSALPINFMINQMEELQMNNPCNCQMCKNNPATYACDTCFKLMCTTCKERHGRVSAFSNHFVKMLEKSDVQCSEHQNDALYVCMECAERICVECVLSDKHHVHESKIVDFNEWVAKEREEVAKIQSELKPQLASVEARLAEAMQCKENIESTMSSVSATYNKVKQKLEKEHQIMKNRLSKEKQNIVNNIAKMQKICSEAKKFCLSDGQVFKEEAGVKDMIEIKRSGEKLKEGMKNIPGAKHNWFSFVPEDVETFGTLKSSKSKPM